MPLPIAHTAAGLIVCFSPALKIRNKLPPREVGVVVVCAIFMANSPDLDFLPGILLGHPNRFHHGISHSAFSGVVFTTLVWIYVKKFVNSISGGLLFNILLLSFLSHVFLDFFSSDTSNPYGIPLLWPFKDEYFISSFPFFRDVMRDGTTNSSFFTTLLNENNLWEVFLEILFSAFLLSFLFLNKNSFFSFNFWAPIFVMGISALLYYGIQIEPNWIDIKRYNVFNPHLEQDVRVVLISDFHLKNISYRENKIEKLLTDQIKPDILLFSGDTFDPFGENNKISLTNKLKELSDYVASLPGEKYLVWGEGIVNNRHLIGKRLSGLGVNILEDEEVSSKKFPEFFIVGKLPELADFVLRTKSDGNKFLSATDTNLNSFLHYQVGSYQELNDYDFLGEFQFNSKDGGLGLTFYSQYNRFSDQFYRIRWSGRSSVPEISPHGTGLLTGRVRARHPLLPEKLYQFRIRCKTETDATRISAKFWRKGDPEPFDWDINAFDSSASRLTSGTIGVWVNGPSVLKLFDNFIVQSADGDHVFVHENFDDSNLYNNRWRTERNFTDEITSSQEDRVSILLTHTPEIINNYSIKDFNLILTGDTHGGQVRWPWGTPLYWDKNLPKDWSSGLHNTIKDIPIYISKGVGFSRLPIRLFCRPEIVVFELNSKQ